MARSVRILRVGPPADAPQTWVLYDVEDDKKRSRVVRVCKDFGLERIQYSAFRGRLSRNRREELCRRLADELEDEVARVQVMPVCDRDAADSWILDQFGAAALDQLDEDDPRLGGGGTG